MKRNILKIVFGVTSCFAMYSVKAQCPKISCPTNIIVNNDSTNCGAVVNYSSPIGIDTCGTGSQTFSYTGGQQIWVVPTGVTSITVDAYGAQGGSNWVNNTNFGGYVQADIAVTPGSTLYVYVGEQPTGLTGGFNGGGNGESAGAGGGGASDIRIGGVTLNDRVIVAGGAGGAGYWNSTHVFGGVGGGLIGGPGYRGTTATPGGDPGTQTSSGNGTCVSFNNPAVAGGFGFGGAPSGCGCEGYGGGGGWYGGAGSGNCRGGGGGSSYTLPSASNVTHTQGVRAGNGEVTISYSGAAVGTTQIAGLASGSVFPVGTTVNTFYASNTFGNDTCSFTVTVNDTELPTITCPNNIVMSNDSGVCGAIVNYNTPVGADNCTGVTTTMTGGLASGSTFPVGVTTVTYVATDASNNQDSCSFTVTVNDTELPTITCPANISSCDSIVTYTAPVGADNCAGVTTAMTAGLASGSAFPIGVTTVTYVATDASNNQDSCSFTVTVNPLPSVVIASFSPDTVCETDPAINLPVGTPASGTYSGNGVVGTTFDPNTAGVGVHYVVYSFTDSNSCTNMDSTMIVVESCVGIDENGTLSGVNFYPNPTSNNLTIELGVLFTEVNLTLTSVDGKIVYQETNITTSKVSVDMSNNSQGIYFLRVEANNQYKVYKVIKE